MEHSTYADIQLKIDWNTDSTTHTERLYHQGINFWRDYFPGSLGESLYGAPDGMWVGETIHANDIVPPFSPANIMQIDINKISTPGENDILVTPRRGRYYPRYIIAGNAGVTADEFLPLRVIDVDSEHITIDLNHPLARHDLEICLRVMGTRYNGKEELGGRCNDVVYELLMNGPGLQLPLFEEIDFYDKNALSRIDDHDDSLLYQQANLEDTFDQASGAQLAQLYGRYISQGDRVLDMMCGAQSYLPNNMKLNTTGIGLNEAELKANKQLSSYVIQNVNAQTTLPFSENSFDNIIFTAAVEYLIDPHESFRELVRITRPGGRIMVTFTDHWVAKKSIRLWSELYPFERLGLISDYFMKAGGTDRLHTETIQGLLRPEGDRHAAHKLYADPVYAVIARVAT